MKLIYFTTASIAVTAIVAFSQAQNFYSSSMCLITDTASSVGSTSQTEAVYNFVEAKIDHTVN
ncbi:MAG: hypothetical protein SAK29_24655 [Scytonema sp. PMC 1069.18]|nr:hypothetical protein [Scytonema sp. PMC 1069.18]MEC4883880.1 hypothetical protein [Scytonema sp. PMC 1070.18]